MADELNQRAKGFGLIRMPEMQVYLDALYARIKAKAGVPEWPGRVFVTASSTLDAYATGAGNIYVSVAWLLEMQHEDELVALLGHEFSHIYLHYHQLEGAVRASDVTANVAALALAIAKRKTIGNTWTPVDTLVLGYAGGRSLGIAAWGRSQESSADFLGLNLSLKLGYSYENGMKLMLERLAAQESKLGALKNSDEAKSLLAEQEKIREGLCRQAIAQGYKGSDGDCSFVTKAEGNVRAALHSWVSQAEKSVKGTAGKTVSDHPETEDRLEQIALLTEKIPDDALLGRMPNSLPGALSGRQTAAILRNYKAAVKALAAPTAPDALEAAKQAVQAPTATHALPLIALYRAQRNRPNSPIRREFVNDPGLMMDANLSSAEDKSWIVVLERNQQLRESYKSQAAKNVMAEGFRFFQRAENVWPDVIRYVGQNEGWPQAKQMAKDCTDKFPSMSEACQKAAITPAEQAEMDRQSKLKAEQLVNSMTKKLKK